jgi:hypothetical protein
VGTAKKLLVRRILAFGGEKTISFIKVHLTVTTPIFCGKDYKQKKGGLLKVFKAHPL